MFSSLQAQQRSLSLYVLAHGPPSYSDLAYRRDHHIVMSGTIGTRISSTTSSSNDMTRWSNGLALSLMNEIFSYLKGVSRLIEVERTCRYWWQQSKNGIGWSHLYLLEWKLPKHLRIKGKLPFYRWSSLKPLLNTRLHENPPMPLPVVTPSQQRNNHNNNDEDNDLNLLREMTQLLASSQLIRLTFSLDFKDRRPRPERCLIIPTISTIRYLSIHGGGIDLIGISSLPNVTYLGIFRDWIPILSHHDYSTIINAVTDNSTFSISYVPCPSRHGDHTSDASIGLSSNDNSHIITDDWIFPHLTGLHSGGFYHDNRYRSSLYTLLMASRDTLQSLSLFNNISDDDIKAISTAKLTRLTSLV
jgi:hypothetical protein